jgi:DNA modification methylase
MGSIKEPAAQSSIARWDQNIEQQTDSDRVPGKTNGNMKAVGGRSKRDSFKRDDSKRAEVIPGQTVGTHRADRDESQWDTETRNKRSVWTVATTPYKGAHFATFPTALIEPCILAGAPAGGVVIDPFFGSGTTGQVAQQLGRGFIGCELNPAYTPLQNERLRQPSLEFA